MSTLTWLDTSEKDRRRTLEFIDTFRQRDPRDELGIGVSRDAFSDLMFPGTNTVQTRAKYFLLVPWCYLKAEEYARRTSAARDTLDTYTRDREIGLIKPLEAGGDVMGLLGRDAKQGLTQLPSATSRRGLGTWGIRRFTGSRARAPLRPGPSFAAGGGRRVRRPGRGAGPARSPLQLLGPASAQLPARASGRDRCFGSRTRRPTICAHILTAVPDSLLARVVGLGVATTVDAPWEHPLRPDFLPAHRKQLFHGKAFSLSIRGAVILYNLLLAEQKATLKHNGEAQPEADALVDRYRDQFAGWGAEMEEAAEELARWDRNRFWQIVLDTGARVTCTAAFVDTWLDMALARSAALIDDVSARRLVREREIHLKGKLSRFTNERSLEIWSEAAGMRRIDYRWSTVQTLVKDIVDGMEA